MNKKSQIVVALILMMCVVSLFAVRTVEPKWRLLGAKKVRLVTDRDVIRVGGKPGVFTAVRLAVHNSGVHFMDMKIHFANGDVMDVKIRKLIRAGGATRIIDLPGNKRYIKKVVFWYKSSRMNVRQATVKLFGRK
jgi:hypothetical protein